MATFDEAMQKARLGRFGFNMHTEAGRNNNEMATGFGADRRIELARASGDARRAGFTGQSDEELGGLFANEAFKDQSNTNPMFGGMSFTDMQNSGGGFNAQNFMRSFQSSLDGLNNPVAPVAQATTVTGADATVEPPAYVPPTGAGGNNTLNGNNGTDSASTGGSDQPQLDNSPQPEVNRDGGMGEVGSSISLFRWMRERGQTPDPSQVHYISQLADREGLSGDSIRNEFNGVPTQVQQAPATQVAQSSLAEVGNAGTSSIAQTLPVGGSSDPMLRAQQQTLARDSIEKGENFGQQAIQNLNPFNVTQSGINFNNPNAQAQQFALGATPQSQGLGSVAQAPSLAGFDGSTTSQNVALNPFDGSTTSQDINLGQYNPNITGGQDATFNQSQYETDLQSALLNRVNQGGMFGGASNPFTASLLADVDATGQEQRQRDMAQLSRMGVLNSGNSVDLFGQGNQNVRRDRLAALSQGAQFAAQNDNSLEAALGLAQLGSNRELDIGALTGRFGGVDTLDARNSQADFGLRGRAQDLQAGQLNQGADLDAQRLSLDSALAGRGQDLQAGLSNQATDLDAQRLSLESILTGRGQDLQGNLANLQAGITGRDQDLRGNIANLEAGIAGRGQDLQAGMANQAADLSAQQGNQRQELGIADRRLMDAERLSGDQRFSSDLGLRQLSAQQDIADRVTSRQLIQGSPTGRETFEEGVRAQLAQEGLQGRSLDESVAARIASMQNQLDLQDRVNSGSLANTTQQGSNQSSIQELLNSGALAQISRQGEQSRLGQTNAGFQDRQLQDILGQQNLDSIDAQGTNQTALQNLLNSGALANIKQSGRDDRSLQGRVNSGAISQINAQNTGSLANITQQGKDANTLQSTANTGAVNLQGEANKGALANLKEQGINTLADLKQMGVNSKADLKELGLNSIADLKEMGVNSIADLTQLGLNSVEDLREMGINQEDLQNIINTGSLNVSKDQGINSLADITQQGVNQTNLQGSVNTGNDALQTLINSGQLDNTQQQGTNQTNLQGDINEGNESLQSLMNTFNQNIATGQFGDQQTLDSLSETQRRNQGDRSFEQILEGLGISNRDASSQIDERQFGQLLGLANASKDNEFLQGQLPDNFFNNFTGAADRLFNQGGSGGFDDFFRNPIRSRAQVQGVGLDNFYQQNENFNSSNSYVDGDELKQVGSTVNSRGRTVARWNDTTKQWESN